MRVEAAPFVFRNEDRRQRYEDRRVTEDGSCFETTQNTARARHEAHLWFASTFGAHILGQVTPTKVTATEAKRAYGQPETRTPLRPSVVQSV